MSTTIPTCGWCPPAERTEATERVVWQHEVSNCWCEQTSAKNDRRHVSYACTAHIDRELADLRDLGFVIVGMSDVTA